MKKFELKEFARGWFIGNFKPTLFNTKKFEIAVMKYKKGDKESAHYHKVAKEYNAIVSGVFRFNDRIVKSGDILLVEPKEAVDFECLKTGVNIVVKVPSLKNDKYLKKS
jgi:mannose-6-phosphate isomerase-like protein (cupin superfamily)